jgi:hypothetical protein
MPVKAKPEDAPVVAEVPSEVLPDAAAVAAAAVVEVVDDVDESGVTAMVVVVVGEVVVVDEVVVVVVGEVVVVVDEVVVVVVASSVALLRVPLPLAADATPTGSKTSAPRANKAAPRITSTDWILLTVRLPVTSCPGLAAGWPPATYASVFIKQSEPFVNDQRPGTHAGERSTPMTTR